MGKIYGYVRVSTMNQKTQRQVDNIKRDYPDAKIIIEKQSGKDIEGRAEFRKLLDKVKTGDTIVFDEVSRMSRNADEGYRLYMDLMEQGINLIFLKEPHINTDEYKRRSENHIARVSSESQKMDNLINGIFALIEDFERENLKDNIRLAFDTAEHEREFLIKRVTEGKAKSDLKQGRPTGSLNTGSAKGDRIKQVIMDLSKDYNGQFSDTKIMKEYLPGVARNTYYKYKKELSMEHEGHQEPGGQKK